MGGFLSFFFFFARCFSVSSSPHARGRVLDDEDEDDEEAEAEDAEDAEDAVEDAEVEPDSAGFDGICCRRVLVRQDASSNFVGDGG